VFWRQTPRETALHLRALEADRRHAFAVATFGAWHAAALARMPQLPELRSLMEGVARRVTEEQSAEEQLAVARVIAASLGG
jgi:hypothetical protein